MSGNNVDRLGELTGEFKKLVAVVLHACAAQEGADMQTWFVSTLRGVPDSRYTAEQVRELVDSVAHARGERSEVRKQPVSCSKKYYLSV